MKRPERKRLTPIPQARSLRIGVLTFSQDAGARLIEPLSRAALPVHPVQIRLDTAADTAAGVAFIRGGAVSFTRAILDEPLDGLVLVGTLEQGAQIDQHEHFRELSEILEYARGFVPSTLGLGAGALVLAHVLGLELEPLPERLSGVAPQRSVDRDHPLLRGGSEVFFAPERRHYRITESSLERAADRVTPLAYSRDAGVSIFESTDRRYIGHLGQPEVDPVAGDPAKTSSAFLDSARASARAHAAGFFAAYVERIFRLSRRQ